MSLQNKLVASKHAIILALIGFLSAAASAHADFRTGEAAFKAGNYADAYLQLLPVARAGDARAQFMLGELSDNGLGPVALDPHEAVRWYRMAAAQDYGEAQFALARHYALGRGVKQDKDEALKWLTRAADNKFEQAILDLARLYADGRGVPQDPVKATALLQRAAELGNPDGQYRYAERLMAGLGIDRDEKAAWAWLRRAADNGQPVALYRLGRVALTANPTIEQTVAGYAWLTLAVQRGDGEVKRDAARDRTELAKQMTPTDIAAAMARVRDWKPALREKVAEGS